MKFTCKTNVLFFSNLKRILSIFFIVLFLFLIGQISGYRFALNTTSSLDGYLFLIKEKTAETQYKKNDIVAFIPPENEITRNVGFIKCVYGVEGDYVSFNEGMVYINKEAVGNIFEKSSSGAVLNPLGSVLIPKNKYFLGTPHPKSFDSRYKQIGLIDESSIIGVATRIF